ncbi:MAG: hypothetical protein MJ131_01025 [Lachnospiraceae bacterium]|nr:hypothetical protein [Lachnospiraceae bacterium]
MVKKRRIKMVKIKSKICIYVALSLLLVIFKCSFIKTEGSSSDVMFYTSIDSNYEKYFKEQVKYVFELIQQEEDENSNIYAGNLLSIYGTNAYFVPIFSDDKCVSIVSIGEYKGNYVINWGKSFSDVLNSLPSGNYSFVYDGNTYIVGEDTKILVESECCGGYEEDETGLSEIIPSIDGYLLPLHDILVEASGINSINSTESTSLTLGSPSFENGGAYGYCWLCAACEISNYFGGTNVSLSGGHNYVHGSVHSGGHSLYNCPGGYPADAKSVVYYYTNRNGTYTGSPLSFAVVANSIRNYQPIYTRWISGSSGHAMVIFGYSYDNNSGVVTYSIKDSNYHNQTRYAMGYDNSTTVNYYMNGTYYTWYGSIYNW